MNKGGYMSVTVVMVFAFAALVASALMYVVRENNDYKVLAQKVRESTLALDTATNRLDEVKESHFNQMKELKDSIVAQSNAFAELEKKYRNLEYEALRPKTVNIHAPKAIPVEIMTTKTPVKAIVRVVGAKKKAVKK